MTLPRRSMLLFASLILFLQPVAWTLPLGTSDACQSVVIKPNLVLGEATVVSGHIVDNKGVPLRNTAVELRWMVSATRESPRQTVQTDSNGNFRFERADPGPYRLLASPTRTYAQPEFLNCGSKRCKLQIELEPDRTDAPDRDCPLR